MTRSGWTSGLQLVLTHETFLRRLVWRMLGDHGLVDDVVQQTFVTAWLHRPDRSRNVRAWLASVARNGALMALRSMRRRTHHEQSAILEHNERRERVDHGVEGPPDETLAKRERCQRLVDLVRLLDEPDRSAVLQRYLEGLTYPEIADRQGISTAAARSRVRRAVQSLQREWTGIEPPW